MTEEEKVLLEQYFPMTNMGEADRAFYLKLLFASKELTDSDYNYGEDAPSCYDFVVMTLNNQGPLVSFEGSISNGKENKLMYGSILCNKNTFFIYTNIYRLSHEVPDVREYQVVDEFVFGDEEITRKSNSNGHPEEPLKVTLMSDEELIEYYKEKIGVTREKKPQGDEK